MKAFKRIWVLLLLAPLSWAATEDYKYQFEDPVLQERYGQLIYELRCPKCQNQNVADSDAPIAADMRAKVYQLLNDGFTDKEIVDYMIERYTEFVTYKTRLNWFTIWAWVLPGLLGAGLLASLFIRARRKSSGATLSEEQQAKIDQLLEKKS